MPAARAHTVAQPCQTSPGASTRPACPLSSVPSHPGRNLAPGGRQQAPSLTPGDRQRDPAFLHGERREGRSRVRVATQAARSAPWRCGRCRALGQRGQRRLRAQSARDTALDPGPAASGAASACAGVTARQVTPAHAPPRTPVRVSAESAALSASGVTGRRRPAAGLTAEGPARRRRRRRRTGRCWCASAEGWAAAGKREEIGECSKEGGRGSRGEEGSEAGREEGGISEGRRTRARRE